LALGIAYWAFRNEMPRPKDLIIVVAIALAVTAGLAWLETRGGEDRYDFIVVPKKLYAVESAFPGPRHDVAVLRDYGDHVQVICLTEGEDGQDWAETEDGYFLPARELAPAPHNGDDPSRC
jgi:hypothetical protein